MRALLVTTCLTPVILFAAGAARAETTVSTARTTAIATSTAASGAPDDVTIAAAGSITLAAGSAVTVDSSNAVSNAGKIAIADSDGATGIAASGGLAGAIDNSGTITIDESGTAADSDKDGDDDGGFASGTGRAGIRIGGSGTFTGNVTNSGTITIEGNDSAGIVATSAIAGSIEQSGTITVTGDRSTGIALQGVSGDVAIGGTISVLGADAEGVAIDGDVGGALTFDNAITATGYRTTTLSTDDDVVAALDADDLLQGGSAVRISGNVAGGILFDAAPTDTDADVDDEDGDGVADADETSAAIYSYGSAPAVAIGAANADITIGAIAGRTDGAGLVVAGVVSGSAVYDGYSATGLAIGGLGGGLGGAVDIAGGIAISGSVLGTANNGQASGLVIGSGTSVPLVTVSGTVSASGGGAADADATGILIAAGANLPALRNTGTIAALLTTTGSAVYAVRDLSGTLASVVNEGSIYASSTDANVTAIDLSANTGGVSIVQDTGDDTATTGPYVSGNVLTGSGNDLIDIRDGVLTGAVSLGAGADRFLASGDSAIIGNVDLGGGDDSLALSGTATFTGDVTLGAGSSMITLADSAAFAGGLLGNTSGLSLALAGGTATLSNTTQLSLASLSLGAGSVLAVTIDPSIANDALLEVSGSATIASGATLKVTLASVIARDQSFVVIHAGALSGGADLAMVDATSPYLYASSVSVDTAAGTVSVDYARKTAQALGLNRSGSAAYDAAYAVMAADTDLSKIFLSIPDQSTFLKTYAGLLPDHSGGIFEWASQGSRLLARSTADPDMPRAALGGSSAFWVQQLIWGAQQKAGNSSGYDMIGWGFAGGYERQAGGFGTIGTSLAYMTGTIGDASSSNDVAADQFELAAYWRGDWKGLRAYARAAGASLALSSHRSVSLTDSATTIEKSAAADWTGTMVSVSSGFSYEQKIGRLVLRPSGAIDYYRLNEAAHQESGGDAFDLSVDSRKSDELAATASLVVGIGFGGSGKDDDGWGRIELEGGYRSILQGELGATTARFTDGADFTLLADQHQGGAIARLRAFGGNEDFRIGGEMGLEDRDDHKTVSARVSLKMGF